MIVAVIVLLVIVFVVLEFNKFVVLKNKIFKSEI